MPVVDQVMTMVESMTEKDRDELLRRLEELDRKLWTDERRKATQTFHAAGLTDDDIDEAVRKLRYETRP